MWGRVPREQQLNVGQSILRYGVNSCITESEKSILSRLSKGRRVNIPVPGYGDLQSLRLHSAATQMNSVTLS